MPYCPKCGNKVTEEMEHCPKCGTFLKAEKVPKKEAYEKQEKQEKQEKDEKAEKHEKGESSRFWALIGGLILVVLGMVSLVTIVLDLSDAWRNAFFLMALGIIIIVFAFYGAARASQRHPQP